MLEKVSEIRIKGALNIDSVPDDDALLMQIDKKKRKKQSGENSLPVAMLPPDTLVHLITASAQGGGYRKPKSRR